MSRSVVVAKLHKSAPHLLRDQRGLTTLEYSLIFVLIVVGAVALWGKLGQSMHSQLASSETAFSSALQGARVANQAALPPPSAQLPVLSNAALPATTNTASAPNTGSTANTSAKQDPAPRDTRRSAHAPKTDAQDAARARNTQKGSSTAQPSAAAIASEPSLDDGDWRSKKVGTGGKVAAVAAGAVAGAAMAAGTSIATAYVASLACGPGAPVCAGAVTVAIAVGLAGYGVHQLMNGGWSALKGSYSRVFSSEDATVGDALSVGTTLGAVAYGIGTTGLSGAGGVARGEAIAQVGARAGAATRAEIASVLSGSTPELAVAGVPNSAANPVPGIVRMSGGDKVGGVEPIASGAANTGAGRVPKANAPSEAPPGASRRRVDVSSDGVVEGTGVTRGRPVPENSPTANNPTGPSATPNQVAHQMAGRAGYGQRIPPNRAPFNSHGQQVFSNGKNFITRDIDSHNGGVWKMFNRHGQRIGTYNADLSIRIGD